MPTLGSVSAIGSSETLNGRSFTVATIANTGGGHTINTLVLPCTADAVVEGQNAPFIERGIVLQESDWMLERIVGKLFIGLDIETTESPAVLCGAGFFVARSNNESGGGGDTPIGSATAAERNENYSPLHEDTVDEPWLWRRTWLLGGSPTSFGLTTFPLNNAFYGSVMDGPHIDAKSVRRIGNDERLWFAFSTASLAADVEQTNGAVRGYLDYRILGALRKSKGKSSF